MTQAPNGIPTITYCRVLQAASLSQGDIVADGNSVVVLEPGQPSSRYEVAQVLDKNLSDEEACELTFGNKAGAGMGSLLNPIGAFVNDSANIVIFLVGSKMTRKWSFLKKLFLPFVANEVMATLASKSQQIGGGFYKAQLSLSAFEILDETISDLLRPGARNLNITTTLDEGVVVQGLHNEKVLDEVTLRRLLVDCCDNRAIQNLPVGGSIDTSTACFELRLHQTEGINNGPLLQTREYRNKMIIVDLASSDALVNGDDQLRLLCGPTLHKSLTTFIDVAHKLNTPYRAQLAPFHASKLTYYLSEMLGGNAINLAMGLINSGEPNITKKTMEIISTLNTAVHYPLAGRELNDTIRGLLAKYRAMIMFTQDDLNSNLQTISTQSSKEHELNLSIERLQEELSRQMLQYNDLLNDKNRLFELCELLKAKYETLLQEKLNQSTLLTNLEDDNLLLAKNIIELKLEITNNLENYEKEKLTLQNEILNLKNEINLLKIENNNFIEKINLLNLELEEKDKIINEKQLSYDNLLKQNENLNFELNLLKEKNLNLNCEILTIINSNEILKNDNEKLLNENSNLMKENENLTNENLKNEKNCKNLLEKLLSKDETIFSLNKQITENSSKYSKNNEMLYENSKNNFLENKNFEKLKKENLELNNSLKRYEIDLQNEKKLFQNLNSEYLKLSKNYENLLLKIYSKNEINFENLIQQKNETNENNLIKFNENNDDFNEKQIENALELLLQFHHNSESVLQNRNVVISTQRDDVITSYRKLMNKYNDTLNQIEDCIMILNTNTNTKSTSQSDKRGNVEAKLKKIIEEKLMEEFTMVNENLKQASSELNDFTSQQTSQEYSDKSQQMQFASESDERNTAIIAAYQKTLQLSEAKIVSLQQENINLTIQIKQLLSQKPGDVASQSPTVPVKGDLGNTNQLLQQQSEQFNVIYSKLSNEIADLKKQLIESKSRLASRKPSSSAVQLIEAVNNATQIIPTPPKSKPTSRMVTPLVNNNAIIEELVVEERLMEEKEKEEKIRSKVATPQMTPKPVLTPFEEQSNERLRSQLSDAEQKLALLSSKQIAMEEELLAYQNYMKDVLPQYQKQVQSLQKKVKKNKVKKDDVNNEVVEDNRLKLPEIKS